MIPPGDRHGKLESENPEQWSRLERRRWTVPLTYCRQKPGGGTIQPSSSRMDIDCAPGLGLDGLLRGWIPT